MNINWNNISPQITQNPSLTRYSIVKPSKYRILKPSKYLWLLTRNNPNNKYPSKHWYDKKNLNNKNSFLTEILDNFFFCKFKDLHWQKSKYQFNKFNNRTINIFFCISEENFVVLNLFHMVVRCLFIIVSSFLHLGLHGLFYNLALNQLYFCFALLCK